MERLSAALNFAGSPRVRRESLYGRPHLVAPARLIVPGVLAGSQGPFFYPADEVGKNVEAWNHVPLLVNHPTSPGASGRDPAVLEAQGVGVTLNARVGVNGALEAEAWLDEARLRALAPRVLAALNAGRSLEVSTGLYFEREKVPPATYNGVAYDHVARNYRPDHLAVLPDSVGACSRKDGCGLLVNGGHCASCAPLTANGGVPPMPLTEAQRLALVADLAKNCKCLEGAEEALNGKTDDQLKSLKAHVDEAVANAAFVANARQGFAYGDVSITVNAAGQFAASKSFEDFKASVAPVVVQNAAKPANQAEWLALMPEDAKPTWNRLQTIAKSHKDALIDKLTANAAAEGKAALADLLGKKSVEQLEEILLLQSLTNNARPTAAPADGVLPDYSGAGSVPARVVNKRTKVNDDDVLLPPEIDWAAEAAAAAE